MFKHKWWMYWKMKLVAKFSDAKQKSFNAVLFRSINLGGFSKCAWLADKYIGTCNLYFSSVQFVFNYMHPVLDILSPLAR